MNYHHILNQGNMTCTVRTSRACAGRTLISNVVFFDHYLVNFLMAIVVSVRGRITLFLVSSLGSLYLSYDF
jgi:hypothetical protein